jgi:hypothetical protein
VICISNISKHKSILMCINIIISSINPYFGTENTNDNRYKEDIINILQKNKGTEGLSLTCEDIAYQGSCYRGFAVSTTNSRAGKRVSVLIS